MLPLDGRDLERADRPQRLFVRSRPAQAPEHAAQREHGDRDQQSMSLDGVHQ
jgi:hypothetical protein